MISSQSLYSYVSFVAPGGARSAIEVVAMFEIRGATRRAEAISLFSPGGMP